MPSPLAGRDAPTPATAPGVDLRGTMIGMPNPLAGAPELTPRPEPSVDLRGTMIGMPNPLTGTPELRAKPEPSVNLRGTMVGMPSLGAGGQAQDRKPSQETDAAFGRTTLGFDAEPSRVTPSRGGSPSSTMPDTPSPVGHGEQLRSTQAGLGVLRGPSGNSSAPPEATGTNRSGTILGVARPGIAPTHRPVEEGGKAHSDPPPPAPSQAPAKGSLPPSKKRAVLGWFLGALALAAAVGAGLGRLTHPARTLRVLRFETNAEAGDFIVIEGKDHPPGTRIRVGTSEVKLEPNGARVGLGRKLAIGSNEVPATILPPGGSPQDETLLVSVAFRVDTSLVGLDSDTPRAKVSVTAPEDNLVSILGKPVPLSGGVASVEVELGPEANGFEKAVGRLEKAVPVVVRQGETEKTATAQIAVAQTPLSLTFPIEGHVLVAGPLSVEGRTSPGALVTVGTTPVVADAQGVFKVAVDGVQAGPLELKVSAPNEAARRARVTLIARAGWVEPPLESGIATALGQRGAFRGTVVELRDQAAVTQFVMRPEGACAKARCLATVLYAQKVALAPGDPVVVTGRVQGLEPLGFVAEFVRRP